MPEFYQTHLRSTLNEAQFLLLMLVVQVLQSLRQVKLESLAAKLPIPIQAESRRKKLQRLFSLPTLTFERLWLPIVLQWLKQVEKSVQTLYLALDRTQWDDVNLLVVSWVKDQRAIPIYWTVLPQLGSSNFKQQKSLLLKVLWQLKTYSVVLLGDREFCSVRLARWLHRQGVGFCLRLRCNEYIQADQTTWVQLRDLNLQPGKPLYFEDIKVTKLHQLDGFNVVAHWQRKYRSKIAKESWFILTHLTSVKAATHAYQKRMGIEQMLRDQKRGGYHLEGTSLKGKRLVSLLVVMTLAYAAATFAGKTIQRLRLNQYVSRPKDSKRKYSRHSYFYGGLYAYAWIHFEDVCRETVFALLQLTPAKRPFYQRGLRAMSLIRATL
ncbi:hypothetical protein AVDCRST_MAG81-997 [uncultured Synechococcales cyanobacterium]|uniref:Transposase IS4-like domain-containing protein n=1 Tax=uncultured Synechococcales cyanobacterium TaxID=1936017 RepID=A0A6J4V047_9CYAN|nr:hypothetical protein AVDCRST_MAG81-997 [uncultured Synechococcales cyanobacterium]